MAELKRSDIIEDEALEAPLILAKNLEVAYQAVMKIAKASKESGIAITAAGNVKALSEETSKLALEQKELEKVSKQIETVNARNNAEYIKQAKALADVRTAMKEKIALGEKDAKTIEESNASMKELNAALQKNKKAYEDLANAEARQSKEGTELLKVIQAQDAQLKHLKETIGENQLKVGQYENALKGLKDEFKKAQNEMVGIAQTLGADSDEFKEAAARAGDLKNEIGDLQSSIKAVAGSKIENIGSSFALVGQKLKALDFKGAGAAAKQFSGAVQDISFTEVKAGASAFGKQMMVLAGQILMNPLFWIPAIILAVGVALFKLKDSIPGLSKAFDALGDSIKFVVQSGKDFLDWIGLTQFAVDEQRQAIADAATENIKTQSDYWDKQIALAKAAGKETIALELAKNKELAAEAVKGMRELNKQRGDYGKFANDEQKQQYEDLKKVQSEALFQIELIQTQHKTDLQKIEDDAAKKRADKAKADAEKRQKEAEAAAAREKADRIKLDIFYQEQEAKKLENIKNNSNAEIDARFAASEDLEKVRAEIAENEMKAGLIAAGENVSAQVLVFEQFQAKLTDIHKQGVDDRNKIAKDVSTDYNADNKKRIDAEKLFVEAMYNAEKDRLDRKAQLIKQDAIDGVITKEQADKQLLALEKSLTDDYIQIIIDRIKRVLEIEGLGVEEQAKLMEQLAELQTQLQTARYDQVTKGEKTVSEKIQGWWEDNGKYVTGALDAIGSVSSAFTERRVAELDAASKENKERLEKDIAAEELANARRLKDAQLTEEQRAILEATAAERVKVLELAAAKREEDIRARKNKAIRKQAIMDKALAIVQSQIQVALSIVKTAGEMGFPAAIPFIAIAAALGAAQVAAIIAKPIPAAEKGIRGHKGGPIIAGEAGAELVRMPGNRLALTDAQARVYDFPAGTDIIPHEETMKMLASDSLRISNTRGIEREGSARIEKKLDKINSTIKNKREWNLTGRVTGYNDGGTRAKYIESLRNRPH